MAKDLMECPTCGSLLEEVGADMKFVYYRCKGGGHNIVRSLEECGTENMEIQRRALIFRINEGVLNYAVTNWDGLQQELVSFCSRYDEARMDIQLQMGILACMTKGFKTVNAEKYQQCKSIFKVTEKLYKLKLKELKQTANVTEPESITRYKANRTEYRRCRDEYRNTKLAWKMISTILKIIFRA